jgi:hypothetical protein
MHIKFLLSEINDLQNIELCTKDSCVLALYIQHLYFGRLPSKPNGNPGETHDEYGLLLRLYLLAVELQDKVAKNAPSMLYLRKLWKIRTYRPATISPSSTLALRVLVQRAC